LNALLNSFLASIANLNASSFPYFLTLNCFEYSLLSCLILALYALSFAEYVTPNSIASDDSDLLLLLLFSLCVVSRKLLIQLFNGFLPIQIHL